MSENAEAAPQALQFQPFSIGAAIKYLPTIMKKSPKDLRIVTINTWKGEGLYDWRLQLMARDLYALEPDIVCLQEAVRSTDFQIDTADFLADYLQMEMVYTPARCKMRTVGSRQNTSSFEFLTYSGLAILSSGSIERHWISPMPAHPEDAERLAFSAQIYHNRRLITVTNLHLTHVQDADKLRYQQFLSVLLKYSDIAPSSAWICCGDFNQTIDEKMIESLEKDSNLQINDCYLKGHGELPGATLVPTEQRPENCRIDYIFTMQQKGQSPLQCRNGHIVLNSPDFEGYYPSDHFGVSVDIHFLPER
ncbi:MAG: endonuclease/exonuclease/phosphatase family protein [Desulfopila sp.]|jgi:endonuclease/exonuclease/phosphatase family metal-dependent hydrolase|nr:endonuclease/exonuclease/phosphatase family protein [Desulfopila sp.]